MSNSWFKLKRYSHIGLPITGSTSCSKIFRLVKNPEYIARYAFFPLLHRVHRSYVYKYGENGHKRRMIKKRHICFATHFDSIIYSYYSYMLQMKYEKWLIENNLTDCVTAYRAIPVGKGRKCKCHIDFAKDVFDYISSESVKHDVAVLVSDISGFFDSLDHSIIKSTWSSLVGSPLPDDYYNVYWNLTHFSYVEEIELFRMFKDNILSKSGDKTVSKSIHKISHMRDAMSIAYCHREDIKKIREAGIIRTGGFKKASTSGEAIKSAGIPQGLPISATTANVYMMEFDKSINAAVSERGGIYRRYSDDIIIVLPAADADGMYEVLQNEISRVNLIIKCEKTKRFLFTQQDDKCISADGRELVYLGLKFDGTRILIKDKSISKYYKKMSDGAYHQLSLACNIENSTRGKFFYNRFLRRFTRIGSIRHSSHHTEGNINKMNHRGNFHSYVYRASRICDNSENIRHQLSRNLAKVSSTIDRINQRLAVHNMCNNN